MSSNENILLGHLFTFFVLNIFPGHPFVKHLNPVHRAHWFRSADLRAIGVPINRTELYICLFVCLHISKYICLPVCIYSGP